MPGFHGRNHPSTAPLNNFSFVFTAPKHGFLEVSASNDLLISRHIFIRIQERKTGGFGSLGLRGGAPKPAAKDRRIWIFGAGNFSPFTKRILQQIMWHVLLDIPGALFLSG